MTSSKERQKKFIARQLEEGRKKKSYFVKDIEDVKIKKILCGECYVLDLNSQIQAAPLIIEALDKADKRTVIDVLVREFAPNAKDYLQYTIKEMKERGLIKEETKANMVREFKAPVTESEAPSLDTDPQWKYRCELIMQKIEEEFPNKEELVMPGRRKLEEILYNLGEVNPKTGKKFEGKTIRRYLMAFYPEMYRDSYSLSSEVD